MSIQKISQRELLENGVQALPNRPSTPSLYSGHAMSASELKAAFDRLPTLIAERFNDLLFATGLFDENDPKEMLSELIATGLFPEHSLAQFFEDVESGALALYLKADGRDSLADVIGALREDLSRLKAGAFRTEGEGEFVSDVSLSDEGIVFHKGESAKQVLKEDTRPVSGGAVHNALAPLSERLDILEYASHGILFDFEQKEEFFHYNYAPRRGLETSALLRLGASVYAHRNLFPERILTAYRGDTLTIQWDEEAACLVLNGTLPASETVTRLVPFRFPFMADYRGTCMCYHSGSVNVPNDGEVSLCLVDKNNANAMEIPLKNEDVIENGDFSDETVVSFMYVGILATSGVHFINYRINVLIQEDYLDTADYTPCVLVETDHILPKSLSVTGPNMWHGETEKKGIGHVSFSPDTPLPLGSLFFSFVFTSDSNTKYGYISFEFQDGTVYNRSILRNQRTTTNYNAKLPIVDIRFYATDNIDASEGIPLSVKDFQIERQDFMRPYNGAFGTPLSYSLTLPEELSRFRDRFYALSTEKYNYFDFENRCFRQNVFSFMLDGSLAFSPVSGKENTYSAPCTPPSALYTKEYRPRSIFHPSGGETTQETVWFEGKTVRIKTTLFENAEALTAFLAHTPIEIVYEDAQQILPFISEECTGTILLPSRPCAGTDFYDETGALLSVASCIEYQTYMNGG